jgi:nucleoside-diphosphate-sugar epimerase
MTHPILVTGAAGRVGGVGGLVVKGLQRRGLPVRARSEDSPKQAVNAVATELGVAAASADQIYQPTL